MNRSILFVLSSALLLMACSSTKTNQNVSKYYDDGRSRPVVGISSVIDSTSYELPWSLSEEFTTLVRNNLSKNTKLFLSSVDDVDVALSSTDNPFGKDISWMGSRFDDNEFIVFLELIKHDDIAKSNAKDLDMSIRVRIIDVRSKNPKIVLQEVLKDTYNIEKGSYVSDYRKNYWGSQEYDNSRMALAHKQLANQVAQRISEYISLSKSR